MIGFFFHPDSTRKNKILYTYVPDSTNVEWIHIIYNDDMVLRYKVNIKERKIPEELARSAKLKQ